MSWYFALENMRLDIDSLHRNISKHASVFTKLLSDEEVSRQIVINDIAAQGSDDEQALHFLLIRFEALRQEINSLHQVIVLEISKNKSISRNQLEELYLYLKEKVRWSLS